MNRFYVFPAYFACDDKNKHDRGVPARSMRSERVVDVLPARIDN